LLLPVVLEDALKIHLAPDQRQIDHFLEKLSGQVVGLPYGKWHEVRTTAGCELAIKLKPAGHILGSAYVE
jgi:metallo-beta-lactamase family protein